jgi:hypothetical protein
MIKVASVGRLSVEIRAGRNIVNSKAIAATARTAINFDRRDELTPRGVMVNNNTITNAVSAVPIDAES